MPILFALGSCDGIQKDLNGKWFFGYYNDNETPNFSFNEIEFSDDSLTLIDEFQQPTKVTYFIKDSSLITKLGIHKFKILEDSLIEIADVAFHKKDREEFDVNLLDIELPNFKGNINIDSVQSNLNYSVIFFGKEQINNQYRIQVNDVLIDFEEIPLFILQETDSYSMSNSTFKHIIILVIDKNSPMKDISQLLLKVRESRRLNVVFLSYYDLTTSNKKLGLRTILLPLTEYERNRLKSPLPPDKYPIEEILQKASILEIQNQEYHYLINDIPINKKDFECYLLSKLTQNPNLICIQFFNEKETFQDFITTKSSIQNVFDQLREFKALEEFRKPLNQLSREEKSKIRKLMPLQYFHFDKKLWDELKLN